MTKPIKPIVKKEGNPELEDQKKDIEKPVEPIKESAPETEEPIIEEVESEEENSDSIDGMDLDDDLAETLRKLREDIGGEGPKPIVYPVPPPIEETPPPYIPIVKPIDDNQEPIEIPYDEESSYFFMYGVSNSGKTVILSGLFYNLLAHRLGDSLTDLNDHNHEHQKRGTVLLNELLEKIPNGNFPRSTTTLRGESQVVPRQINHEFGPRNQNKPPFKFTMMDMSGEDLMKVRVGSDNDNEKLNAGIETFLKLPNNNLAFICVYPAESDLSHSDLSSHMRGFLNELDRIGHHSTPMVFVVSKWDKVKDKYDSVEDFFKDRDPIIWNKISEPKRNSTIMKFSIGDVDHGSNTFKYDPSNSNKLFQWMYQTQTGVPLDEELSSKSGFASLMSRFFGSKN